MSHPPYTTAQLQDADDPIFGFPSVLPIRDERRMNIKAYNYWASLLRGRLFPSIMDLEPDKLREFEAKSLLLGLSDGPDNPRILYLGSSLRDASGVQPLNVSLNDVPQGTIVSRLAHHYLEIIANRAPIAFEAEFISGHGALIMYRGILLPLSSDGEVIDFIYGVVSWKEAADQLQTTQLMEQLPPEYALTQAGQDMDTDSPAHNTSSVVEIPDAEVVEAEIILPAKKQKSRRRPSKQPVNVQAKISPRKPAKKGARKQDADVKLPVILMGEDSPVHSSPEETVQQPDHSESLVSEQAFLGHLLAEAQAAARRCRKTEKESGPALSRALGLAYDFYLAALAKPEAYQMLVEQSGIKVQQLEPMAAVAKLIFGAEFGKARLAEVAEALAEAGRHGVQPGKFEAFWFTMRQEAEAQNETPNPGRSEPQPVDEDERRALRQAARSMPSLGRVELDLEAGGEFILLLARRSERDSSVDVLAPVSASAEQIYHVLETILQKTDLKNGKRLRK